MQSKRKNIKQTIKPADHTKVSVRLYLCTPVNLIESMYGGVADYAQYIAKSCNGTDASVSFNYIKPIFCCNGTDASVSFNYIKPIFL